jgi:hypothetical protein
MKSICSSIVFVALVSLLCLLIPGNASAQIKPPLPCCLNSPSVPDSLTGFGSPSDFILGESHRLSTDSMSPTYSINPKTSFSSNVFKSNGTVRYSSSSDMPIMDRKDAYRLVANDRKITFGERS